MYNILTTTLTLLAGFDPNNLGYKYIENKPLILIEPVSPTLNLDPWESYRNKKHQEISDQILEQEIKSCGG